MRKFVFILGLAIFAADAAHAGFATGTEGYKAGRYTRFYWLADGEVHRADVQSGKLVAPENFVADTDISVTRAEYDRALDKILKTSLAEDAQATAQIEYYNEQIALHEKALAGELSAAERERRLAIVTSLKAKFPELRKKTVAWTRNAIDANVLTPKELVLTENDSVEAVPENLDRYLAGVYNIVEARHLYEKYSEHGTVACEYYNFESEDYDHPKAPKRRGWNMQINVLLPDLATRQEANDRCKAIPGLNAAFEMYLFDIHGISITEDYDGSKKCRNLASSAIGEKLSTFGPTGSQFADVSRMMWLRIPSAGAFQGIGYPRVGEGGAPARPIALMMSETGEHCHVNGPWQTISEHAKLNAVCAHETIWGPGWIDPEKLGFACRKLR